MDRDDLHLFGLGVLGGIYVATVVFWLLAMYDGAKTDQYKEVCAEIGGTAAYDGRQLQCFKK